MFVKIFQVSSDEEWVNKVNLSSFQLKNFFKIRGCVISARRAKHFDSTHVYILSCKHISRTIRARAYYLSYYKRCYQLCSSH